MDNGRLTCSDVALLIRGHVTANGPPQLVKHLLALYRELRELWADHSDEGPDLRSKDADAFATECAVTGWRFLYPDMSERVIVALGATAWPAALPRDLSYPRSILQMVFQRQGEELARLSAETHIDWTAYEQAVEAEWSAENPL